MSLFQRPYPRTAPAYRAALESFLIGVFAAIFLIAFRPFLFGQAFPAGSQYLPALEYGGISTGVMLFLYILLPWAFPRVFDEENWTVGKEIVTDVCCFLGIALASWGFTVIRYGLPCTMHTCLYFVGMIVAVGAFPYVLFLLVKQNRLLRKYRAEAAAIQPQAVDGPAPTQEVVVLSVVLSDDQRQVPVPLASLLYIASSDNYVKVVQRDNAGPKSRLLRNTLKQVEAELREHPHMFRCHRGYIVNLSRVVGVTGNAQGLKLQLEGNISIPVSRSLNQEIGRLLQQIKPPTISF